MQSRRQSFIESVVKAGLSFAGAVVIQMIVARWITGEFWNAVGITAIFAGWSVCIGYCVRRGFERLRVEEP